LKNFEHIEQVNLIKWWSLAHKLFGVSEQLLFAIPNGGNRNIITATMLKAEGVRAGVPDLFLAVPHGDKHGLFIEMKKTKGGRVSDSQSSMIECLIQNGYAAVVCRGWIDAKTTIENYFKD
jgi:hypothetical protein